MPKSLDIEKIVSLKRQELAGKEEHVLERLISSTQSIYHRTQISEYHYSQLEEIASKFDLVLDWFSTTYRRPGDTVVIRFAYEANIFAFLQNLHALIDSFPYALNLYFRVFEDLDTPKLGWSKEFIGKYRDYPFNLALKDLCVNEDFQLLRGYTNKTKHKNILRVRNKCTYLEFEKIDYDHVTLDAQGGFCRSQKTSSEVNVMEYLARCHDNLMPIYFGLWEEVMMEKERSITNG